jgi:hypothetical protein
MFDPVIELGLALIVAKLEGLHLALDVLHRPGHLLLNFFQRNSRLHEKV